MNDKQSRFGEWSPDIRKVIFHELGGQADEILRELATKTPTEQPDWLVRRCEVAVRPYVTAGANPNTMMFWVGMLLGSRVRRQETKEEVIDVPLG